MKPLPGDNKGRGFKTLRAVTGFTAKSLLWLLLAATCVVINIVRPL